MIINNYNIDVSKLQQNSEGYWIRNWRNNITLFNETHKSCSNCKKIKTFNKFFNREGYFLKLKGKCKFCDSEYNKKWNNLNKNYKRTWVKKNKNYYNEYYNINKHRINNQRRKYTQKYYTLNKEKIKEKEKEFAKYNNERLPLGYKTRNKNDLLQVKCFKCKQWMFVTNGQLRCILQSQNGTSSGINNIYCSDYCKTSCNEFYNMSTNREIKAFELGLSLFEYNLLINNSKDLSVIKITTNRAKERDNYTCQNCNSKENLHGHHIIPIALCLGTNNEYLIYETSNIKTVCLECHNEIHSGDLSLNELKKHNKISICLS